jgi:hypothetical protein
VSKICSNLGLCQAASLPSTKSLNKTQFPCLPATHYPTTITFVKLQVKGFYVHLIISQTYFERKNPHLSFNLRLVDATSAMVTGICESGGCLQIFGGGLGAGGGVRQHPPNIGGTAQIVSQFDNIFCIKNPTISVRKGQIVSQWALV